MPRSGRQVPSLYFGRPGALVTLPWTQGDQDATYERPTFDFVTGAGQHVVSTMATGSRSYRLNWSALHVDTLSLIDQYRIGANGPGPWAYIDPARPNLLPANVAAATGLNGDTSGFILGTGLASDGVLTSNSSATYLHRATGWRSLRWHWPTAVAGNIVLRTASGYRSWYGDPVVPGLSYAFSAWLRADGVIDTSINVQIQMQWLNASGGEISVSAGTSTAISGWTRLSHVATAPAGAAYLSARWVAISSTILTGASLYIDEPMLEQDTVVNDWAPGTGLRPVEIVGLPERVPFDVRMRTGTTLDLRELAA